MEQTTQNNDYHVSAPSTAATRAARLERELADARAEIDAERPARELADARSAATAADSAAAAARARLDEIERTKETNAARERAASVVVQVRAAMETLERRCIEPVIEELLALELRRAAIMADWSPLVNERNELMAIGASACTVLGVDTVSALGMGALGNAGLVGVAAGASAELAKRWPADAPVPWALMRL